MSLLARWRDHAGRYGRLHALSAYAGRRSPALWRRLGPLATRAYLRRWTDGSGPKRLQLGSGGRGYPGWLGADVDPRADVYMDLTRPLPLSTGSVDAIYAEEVLEHLSIEAGTALLAECRRVLVPGGVLRLTTPDLAYLAELVRAATPEQLDYWRVASPGATAADAAARAVNGLFYGHGHRFLYDAACLEERLRAAGFDSVRRSSYRDPASRWGALDSHAERYRHPPELCLYYEATSR